MSKKTFSTRSKLITAYLSQKFTYGKMPTIISGYTGNMVTSMFFDKESLYSYGAHYELARIVKNGEVVLVNNSYYSNTTAKQKLNLLSHLRESEKRVYLVSDIEDHYRTIQSYKNDIQDILNSSLRRRVSQRFIIDIREARSMVMTIESYIKEFELPADKKVDYWMTHLNNLLLDKNIIFG